MLGQSEPPRDERTASELSVDPEIRRFEIEGILGRETSLPIGVAGRYVRLQKAGGGYLSLAEVQVFGSGTEQAPPSRPAIPARRNLALDGAATQSSTRYGGVAARANDGSSDGAHRNASVTHTANQGAPWWQVDLGRRADIDEVVVFNRTDCCTDRLSDIEVLISDYPFEQRTRSELAVDPEIRRHLMEGVLGLETRQAIGESGRYVRLQKVGGGFLSLAEVQVFGSVTDEAPPPRPSMPVRRNLALDGDASQASTSYGGVPGRANDGSTDGAHRHSSVTHTANQSQPWWQVDLGASASIDEVVIFNRTDCCTARLKDAVLLVSETPFGSRSLSQLLTDPAIKKHEIPGILGVETRVALQQTARYVRLQLSGSGFLSLAEVQVFGESLEGDR